MKQTAHHAEVGRARTPAREAGTRGPSTGGFEQLQQAGNQALRSLLTAGRSASGPGPAIHEGHAADRVLSGLGARGAAVGRNILLSRSLGAAERASVLGHEMRHVAQTGGRDVDPAAPMSLGSRGDRWERAARGTGDPGSGADPQVIRRDGPPVSSPGDDAGVCEPGDSPPLASLPEADTDADAGTCDVDETALLSTGSESLTTAGEIELSSDPARHVCALPYANASFDPEAVDVAGMRNDTLNSESLRVDAWVDEHSFMSPRHADLGAYQRLRQRLRAERAARVQLGHLWMTTAVETTPDELLMLNASAGETVIIRVDQSIAAGVPNQSFPGPIMTRQQFDDHMSGLGIPILTEEEYIERLRETARQIAPQLLMPPGAAPAGIPLEGAGHGDPFGAGSGLFGSEALLSGQTAGIAVGSSRLYNSPFSINATGAFADPLNSTGGGEIMTWRGAMAEAGFQSRAASGFGLATTPLNDLDWTNYRGANPRLNRASQRNYPVFDFERTMGTRGVRVLGVSRVSVKTSLIAEQSSRLSYYRSGLVDMLDARASPTALEHYIRNQPGQTGTVPGSPQYVQLRSEILETARVAVNADDVPMLQSRLQDASANWDSAEYRRIYTGVMRENPITILTPSGQQSFDSPAALDAANLSDGDRAFVQSEAGRRAAGLVVSSGITTEQIQALRTRRQSVPAGMSTEDLGRWVTPEYIEDARFGSVGSTGRSSARGAGAGSVLAVITTAGTMIFDEADHPEWERELAASGAMGALGGGLEAGVEHQIVSRGTQYAIARGGSTWFTPRGLKIGGSTAAGAVVAPILEGVDMWTDERENPMEEVVVRTGRAAVIGGGAGWAGAAVGTAIGGPVGFVVGFGVGAAVGWLANKLLPGSGEDYARDAARREAERRRREELERRRVEAEARLEAERRRQRRLNSPLSGSSASSVGVEGLFSLPVQNPDFMTSDSSIEPTIGQLEHEYILTILRMSEEGRP